ncbi:MAG: hypothetical protein ACPL1I_09905 [bacterium]
MNYNPFEREFLTFLEQEEELYSLQLDNLDGIKNNHLFNIGNLESYRSMLQKLSNQDMKTLPYRSAFITVQVARMIHTFLLDLKQMLKEYTYFHKEKILSKIDELLQKSKRMMDQYYQIYGKMPDFRFREKWYFSDRAKYLPFYPYEEYYKKLYPPKESEMELKNQIFFDLTRRSDDYYDSKQFVPASFQGSMGEYDQFLALQAYKELKKLQPHNLGNDSNLPLSEKMLNKIRRGERYG